MIQRSMLLMFFALTLVNISPLMAASQKPSDPPPPAWAPVDTTVPGHPALLPTLSETSFFPRFSPEQLAWNGYPDHQHAYFWPDWVIPVDEAGAEYGFGSMCRGVVSKNRSDLKVEPGKLSLGFYDLEFSREAKPCFVAPYLGLCEMAEQDVRDILGLSPRGRLRIINPDDVPAYKALTGYGVWRMFRLSDDVAVVQPVGILARRTLIGHAAWDMVAQWSIKSNTGDTLPEWMVQGTAAWFCELGVHLCNYMAMDRATGVAILMSPDQVEIDLRADVMADDEADKTMWRRARYNAFLMVWRLVEHHGGLDSLRDLLQSVAAGDDADHAVRRIYGHDLAGLATALDPLVHGEPIGDAVQQRNPARQP